MVVRRVRALLVAAIVVSASVFVPAAVRAAAPASAIWWFDGYQSFGGNGYEDSNGATFVSFAPQAGDPPLTRIDVSKPGFSEGFGAMGADDTAVAPGTYADALNPRTAGHPYFFTYDAFACIGTATGSFIVHEVAFDGSRKTTKFAADLAWTCSASPRVHYRAVRYNSSWPTGAIALSAQRIDFGTTVIGQAIDRTVTITGNGTTPVTVTSASIAGDQADAFGITSDGCTGVALAPGTACEIGVRALPLARGSAGSALIVTTDGYAAQEDVPLSQVALQPTAVTVHMAKDVVATGSLVSAIATVTPTGATGDVYFRLDGNIDPNYVTVDPSTGIAEKLLPASFVGTHTVTAHFGGPGFVESVSAPASFITKRVTTVTIGASVNPAAATEPVTLTAVVTGTPAYEPPTSGTLSIVDQTTATPLATLAVTNLVQTVSVTTSFADIGTHTLIAEYLGETGDWIDSSAALNLLVGADTAVNATGVTVNGTSIYPYRDGYRDTLIVSGIRNETATVAINVTSSATHRVVGSANVLSGVGPYSWTWTGRTSSGALLPAGTYVIKQTLRDTSGNTLVVSRTVSLSAKRLYWHTGTVTIPGNRFQLSGTQPYGSHQTITKRSTPYPNEVRIHVGNPGWVALEYQVIEPSASSYGTITVSFKGKIAGRAWIGVWRPAMGSYRNIDAYDSGKVIGPGTTTWSTAAIGPTHISARHVHVLVYIGTPFGSATMDVASVKVTYRYGILK